MPRGEQRLDLSNAYCCVESRAPQDARALAWLLRSVLQPDRELLASLAALQPGPQARLVAWLASAGESYRLAIDVERRRLQLGEWDAAASRYRARSSDPEEIAALFAQRCWPDRLGFESLRTWGLVPPEGWAGEVASDAAEQAERAAELERLRAAQALRAQQCARRDELRAHGQQLAEREHALAAARSELEEQAPLAAVADGLEPRIAAFRAALDARDADRREIDAVRRKLLAERSSLRGARDRRRAPLWLGISGLALGAILAAIGETWGALLIGLGAVLASVALVQSRGAHRRLGRIEAVLAAQRVRERTAEQRFESETEPLRAALGALELPGLDALRSALAAYRELEKRAADLEAGLRAARAARPEAHDELARLEQELARPDPSERIAELEAQARRSAVLTVRTPVGTPSVALVATDPEELIASAARGTGLDPDELRARLAAALPLYLRALSSGTLTHARHRAGEGWVLRGPEQSGIRFAELPIELGPRVSLAFQLALAERTAGERDAPFLIGPAAPALAPDQTRALRRLAGFVQVIRVGPPHPAWAAHADSLVTLVP
jgi:hypothetical protein